MGNAPDPAEHGHGVLPAVPAAALLLPVHRHRGGAGRGANLSSGIIGCATYLRKPRDPVGMSVMLLNLL